jgi:glycine hydroxymethyltransferase
VRGKDAEIALDKANITVNKNGIPFDQNPPMNPSGIRLGSPAVTTRGFEEGDMAEVGACIAEVLRDPTSESNLTTVRARVKALTDRYPLYHWKNSAVTA